MVCQGMADETTWLADLAGVRFSYSSNVEHLPFQGSKSLLTQMLLALVSNGVRAAGKEGEVEMKLHAEHGRCVISVRDSGVGIPKSDLPNIKNKFYKANRTRPGSGIGLALADEIIRRHKGRLEIDSEEGVGTTVTITLPTAEPG